MGNSTIVSLRRHQWVQATRVLNGVARHPLVSYGYWPLVDELISFGRVDVVEIVEFCRRGRVIGDYPHLRVPRYDVGPGEELSNIAMLTVALVLGCATLEIVALELAGA